MASSDPTELGSGEQSNRTRMTVSVTLTWAPVGLWREAERLEDGWVMVIPHTEGLQVL